LTGEGFAEFPEFGVGEYPLPSSESARRLNDVAVIVFIILL
jgi:hypothetical protein